MKKKKICCGGNGRILCEDVQGSRALKKFVVKRLERWMVDHEMADETKCCFEVAFTREGAGHQVSCGVEIETVQCRWQGAAVSEGAQPALIESLEQMHPVEVEAV